MKYIKETIKIGDLFKLLNLDNNKYKELQKGSFPIYIKNVDNEITPILGYVKKHVNLCKYKFKSRTTGHEYDLVCSDKHILINENGENCLAKDIKSCQNLYEGLMDKISAEYLGEGDAYDISIKAPHLYYTSNGIIHHNTSYIRHLIYELKGHKFMVLDNSVFDYITDASFVKMLMNNKNSIIILEDCEEMLADRIAGNKKLAALLNLSDGILGDSFKFKFICTFNTNVANLDKAILRKGRTHTKYEFKKLCAEKTYALGKEIGKDIPEGVSLTLADIYNYGVDNGTSEKKLPLGFIKNK